MVGDNLRSLIFFSPFGYGARKTENAAAALAAIKRKVPRDPRVRSRRTPDDASGPTPVSSFF